MARRTGILVQMQRDAARRQRERQRAAATYARQQAQAQRDAQRAEREALRTQAAALRLAEQHAKADARAQADAIKQQKQAHLELQQARVASQNADLEAEVAELEQLLSATLEVDDFINLESLKRTAEHPPFQPGTIGRPTPPPRLENAPAEPSFAQFAPPPPTGMAKVFGKGKHERGVLAAQQQFAHAHARWQQELGAVQQRNSAAARKHQQAEHARIEALKKAKRAYDEECAERESEVSAHNADVAALAAAFARREPQAVLDYFTLVLANSDYPDNFPQQYRLAYIPESTQIVVEYELPDLTCVPAVREYKYVKSKDEVSSTARPARDIKALYGSVVAQIALRTLHEIFEADRTGLVDTVVFNGMVTTTDPGTGKEVRPCLVTVRTTREVFADLDLALVEPLSCLERLNASVSKRPSDLAPVRPVLEFDMVDKRFIEETDVLSSLDQRPNLMELTPSEFEALIQNLFSKMGLDTKQTRPSRDGGVDCVAYDPRPIFGGKVVIQAKRYRNTVDVSAVRDLFGTMQNEGASKGILVTTSGYGPASYDFAAGKPLELIDGSNLLYLLTEHAGMEAKIVPPEA
ncbi:restriction endonuclease [Amycolatopsis sp. NPDC051102]|uniref:restriction endonuclease n=1 Tax=Amycolatopsis sp. NPDC051102 TaxID=3155163 RepID=UPI00341D61F1